VPTRNPDRLRRIATSVSRTMPEEFPVNIVSRAVSLKHNFVAVFAPERAFFTRRPVSISSLVLCPAVAATESLCPLSPSSHFRRIITLPDLEGGNPCRHCPVVVVDTSQGEKKTFGGSGARGAERCTQPQCGGERTGVEDSKPRKPLGTGAFSTTGFTITLGQRKCYTTSQTAPALRHARCPFTWASDTSTPRQRQPAHPPLDCRLSAQSRS
jgi:hypothetical protein